MQRARLGEPANHRDDSAEIPIEQAVEIVFPLFAAFNGVIADVDHVVVLVITPGAHVPYAAPPVEAKRAEEVIWFPFEYGSVAEDDIGCFRRREMSKLVEAPSYVRYGPTKLIDLRARAFVSAWSSPFVNLNPRNCDWGGRSFWPFGTRLPYTS